MLNQIINEIKPVDEALIKSAKEYLNSLAKPLGSLGQLEEIAARLSAILKTEKPIVKKRCIIVCAADNGIVEEGVASAPQEVTAIQTKNIAHGVTGVGVLAKCFSTDIIVADIGVCADFSDDKILNRKVRKSTRNFSKEAALTITEVHDAMQHGIQLAKMAKNSGYLAVGVGEMGIGNTTTSSAVLASLLSLSSSDIENVVGKGAGLSKEAYAHKVKLIKNAIAMHKPKNDDVIDVLSKVGGLDIAAMAGIFIGCAYHGLPVVIDGFISIVAALCAVRLCPNVRDYMFASHHSYEQGYAFAMKELRLTPCLQLDMRLGEGSGCPLMFAVMDGALSVINEMATFEDACINPDYLDNISKMNDDAFAIKG